MQGMGCYHSLLEFSFSFFLCFKTKKEKEQTLVTRNFRFENKPFRGLPK